AVAPIGPYPVGMVMGCEPDARVRDPREHHLRKHLRAAPGCVGIAAVQRAIAGEGELAPGRTLGALEYHGTNRLGKGGVPDPVDDDLSDGLLAFRIIARFIEHRRGEAVPRAA